MSINKIPYSPKDIENKWKDYWLEHKIYKTEIDKSKEKMHVLDMFPYPSGEGLHAGHCKVFSASDAYARFKRMQGYNVLHATGWDAFGLPAEQYALKNKVHPKQTTKTNTENYKRQMQLMGLSYDWDREINTTDPKFYKWTQWIFLELYKKGLVFESYEPINWCPSCKTGLANEDLEDGKCERCGSVVEKKPIRQWVIRITDYAEKLLKGVDDLEWKESIKELQRNWIGKSEGAEIDFELKSKEGVSYSNKFTIFTTRPDTLFGCTYTVFAPEHALVREMLDKNIIKNKEEVEKYIDEVKNKTEIERSAEGKEKTGVRLEGVAAINPANKKAVPVYIADYVMASYGSGAIMAVPAHDARDLEFAVKYNIEVLNVIEPVYTREDALSIKDFKIKNKIVAIVENEKEEILIVNWGPKMGGKLFLGGTIEEGEKPEETALRELKEETGYTDIKIISVSDESFDYKYFAHSKGVAFNAITKFVHIKLNSLEKIEQKLEEDEKNKFEIEWLNKNIAEKEVVEVLHKYAFDKFILNKVYAGSGKLHNSENFNGMFSEEAGRKIVEYVGGKMVTKYKLRDWVFARQRYWGEPFPIVFNKEHKPFPVAASELPVELPDVKEYEPTGNGESPLANIKDWVEVRGVINEAGEFIKNESGEMFYRETNTMPQWAGSSWYWLRYMDPNNENRFVGIEEEKYWSGKDQTVDMYLGGMEHATRHLIYGRFWHQFLFDLGYVTAPEPFKRLEAVGLVLAEDGSKMSKRSGNVVNPDDVVERFGADTMRVYLFFMGPYHDSVSWNEKNIIGSRRFLERVWALQYSVNNEFIDTPEVIKELHKTIKKVGLDIEKLGFNTAISQLMILLNKIEKENVYAGGLFGVSFETYSIFLKLLAPFAPFMTEEIFASFGGITKSVKSIHLSNWPKYDEVKIIDENVTLAVQINGKLRGEIKVNVDEEELQVLELLKVQDFYQKWTENKEPKKIIIVKNKIVNVVM